MFNILFIPYNFHMALKQLKDLRAIKVRTKQSDGLKLLPTIKS